MKKPLFKNIKERLRLNQKAAIFLLCVFFSVIFWVFTSLSKEYETQFLIPVSYRNIPFTKYFDSELPQQLELKFKGTGFRLAGLHFRSLPDSIVVDVAAFSDAQKQLNLQTLSLAGQFPGELKPYRIVPEIIRAGFSSRLSKKVPVVFTGNLTFKSGFEAVGKVRLLPDSIELAGTKSALDRVKEVRTVPMNLQQIGSDRQGVAELDSLSFPQLAASVNRVTYSIRVEEFTEGVVEVPVQVPVSQRQRVTLIPNHAKIVYSVALSSFSEVEEGDFAVAAEVPFSGMPARLPVVVKKQPEGVRIVKIEPEFVDYLIQR